MYPIMGELTVFHQTPFKRCTHFFSRPLPPLTKVFRSWPGCVKGSRTASRASTFASITWSCSPGRHKTENSHLVCRCRGQAEIHAARLTWDGILPQSCGPSSEPAPRGGSSPIHHLNASGKGRQSRGRPGKFHFTCR